MALRIREEAAGLPVYRPGRRPPLVDGLPAYKLSSNENPYPPLPGVLAAATQACAELNRYPDITAGALTEENGPYAPPFGKIVVVMWLFEIITLFTRDRTSVPTW